MTQNRPMDDNLEWLAHRRSVRRYRPEPLSDALIQQLMTAAIWAPSAHNRQPWRFAVITGKDKKHALARSMGEKLEADLTADGLAPELIAKDVGRSYKRIANAPLVILLSLSMDDMDIYPDEQRQQNEWIMAVQSVAMAGQNVLLAAHALGLGACWMCAPLFCPGVVREALGLPEDWQPQALITVGFPDETRGKDRLPLADRVRYFK
jgi:coenzyme F420-0:L-glutamate ligase/coenzyme F420-1:gamma-L-glutamate ligase